MRIVLFSQYFPPEVGATQTRVEVFARYLAGAGHDVTVVAEVPNHPFGVVFDGWRRTIVRTTREQGYRVVRVWVAASPRKSFWRRIAFYLTYAMNAVLAALLVIRRRPDVVVASSPPLPVAVAGAVVAGIWRRPFVADIRDLWPAVGVALGELSGDRAVNAAKALERLVYRRSAAITCVTRTFVQHVVSTGTPPDRVHLVPNGTLPDLFSPDHVDPSLRERLGLGRSFVVGYVGLHGIAQGLPALVDAACALRDDDVRFLFVGDGPVKVDLVRQAASLGLDNVLFHDQVPLEDVVPLVNTCDAVIVPLRRLDILAGFIPSKLFDMMACEKPVLLMVDGEARAILEEAGAGAYVEAENSVALADAIRSLRANPTSAKSMGERGREYVLRHYVRENQAAELERLLIDLAGSGKRVG